MKMLQGRSEDDKGRDITRGERLVIEPGSYGRRKGQWRRSGEQ